MRYLHGQAGWRMTVAIQRLRIRRVLLARAVSRDVFDGEGRPMIAIGRHVYGLGVIGLGLVTLVYEAFDPNWLPVPSHVPGYHLLVYAAGTLLVLGGVAINAQRVATIAALGLAVFFAVSMLLLVAPSALMRPAVWVNWQSVAESAVMALGGVFAYALAPEVGGRRSLILARIARLSFGVCLLIFGASHFVYARFTAALAPRGCRRRRCSGPTLQAWLRSPPAWRCSRESARP
jgi:hypothetical protein